MNHIRLGNSLKLYSSAKGIRVWNELFLGKRRLKIHELIIALRFFNLNELLFFLEGYLLKRVQLIIIPIIDLEIDEVTSILQLILLPLLIGIELIRIIIVATSKLLL